MTGKKKIKDANYGTKTAVQGEKGIVDFDPDKMSDVVGGETLTYDEYVKIQIESQGKIRGSFQLCYYEIPLGFRGEVERITNDKICFKRIFVAIIERFSVGVSCGIYSYRILKRCGGAYFCRRYFFFEPVINEKRKRSNAGNHYDEFEKLAIRLKKDYEKKSKTKYDWNAPIAKEDLEITFVSEIENAVFIPSESCTTNVP